MPRVGRKKPLAKRPPPTIAPVAPGASPVEDERAQQVAYQQFYDQLLFSHASGGHDRRVREFRRQFPGLGQRAADVVRECAQRFELETAEVLSAARATTVRALEDSMRRSMQIYLQADRVVFVKGEKGVVRRETVPDWRARLRALQVRNDSAEQLCRLLGLDQPVRVEVTHAFDEDLARAIQEADEEDLRRIVLEEVPGPALLPRGR